MNPNNSPMDVHIECHHDNKQLNECIAHNTHTIHPIPPAYVTEYESAYTLPPAASYHHELHISPHFTESLFPSTQHLHEANTGANTDVTHNHATSNQPVRTTSSSHGTTPCNSEKRYIIEPPLPFAQTIVSTWDRMSHILKRLHELGYQPDITQECQYAVSNKQFTQQFSILDKVMETYMKHISRKIEFTPLECQLITFMTAYKSCLTQLQDELLPSIH